MNFVEVVLIIVLGMLLIILREYVTSRSKKLGEIEETLANLPKTTEIQTALTDAVQQVEYSYWQQQQIEQLKREKIESLMNEVVDEQAKVHQAYLNCLGNQNNTVYITHNHNIKILIDLYFEDLEGAYTSYVKSFNVIKSKLYDHTSSPSSLNFTKISKPSTFLGDALKLHGVSSEFKKGYEKFVLSISNSSKGLTKLIDSEQSTTGKN